MSIMSQPLPEEPNVEPDSEATGFDEFCARAAHLRGRSIGRESGRPQSWANPDPAAIGAVAGHKHPITYVLSREQGRLGDANTAQAVRRCCEDLQGADRGSLTRDDVMTYPWHHVDAEVAARYYRHLKAGPYAIRTRNYAVSVLRRIVAACYRAGLISAARRDEVLEELPTVTPGRSARARRLSEAEIDALLLACRTSRTTGARDAAIVALFATSGLRVSELVDATVDDLDLAAGTLHLRMTKNGSAHRLQLHPATAEYLRLWLEVRGMAPGPLFTSSRGEGLRALTTRGVRDRLAALAAHAGVVPFGTHDFRRTFATGLLRTHDAPLVGRLLNHRKLASTLIYDMASDEELRSAVSGLGLLPPHPTSTSDGQGHVADHRDEGAA